MTRLVSTAGIAPALMALATALPAAPAEERGVREAVAVVCSLSGTATGSSGQARSPLKAFDWLQAGTVIDVAAGSKLVLAFASGKRFELDGGSRATLGAAEPKASVGTVRPLDAVPPLPRVAAIAEDAPPGTRSAAIRLRSGPARRVRGLYPNADSAALPDATVLRFAPIDGAVYEVELEDESGRSVFEAQTRTPALGVPAGILRPAARYYWRVKTVESVGPAVRGEAEFVTLAAEDAERRSALKTALEARGDASSLGLLAEVDRRLGLLVEARLTLESAISKAPGDATLRDALASLERQLADAAPGGS